MRRMRSLLSGMYWCFLRVCFCVYAMKFWGPVGLSMCLTLSEDGGRCGWRERYRGECMRGRLAGAVQLIERAGSEMRYVSRVIRRYLVSL